MLYLTCGEHTIVCHTYEDEQGWHCHPDGALSEYVWGDGKTEAEALAEMRRSFESFLRVSQQFAIAPDCRQKLAEALGKTDVDVRTIENHLWRYANTYRTIGRIQDLMQRSQERFGVELGDDTLDAAIRFLESVEKQP